MYLYVDSTKVIHRRWICCFLSEAEDEVEEIMNNIWSMNGGGGYKCLKKFCTTVVLSIYTHNPCVLVLFPKTLLVLFSKTIIPKNSTNRSAQKKKLLRFSYALNLPIHPNCTYLWVSSVSSNVLYTPQLCCNIAALNSKHQAYYKINVVLCYLSSLLSLRTWQTWLLWANLLVCS